jgi:hypothetical protein
MSKIEMLTFKEHMQDKYNFFLEIHEQEQHTEPEKS